MFVQIYLNYLTHYVCIVCNLEDFIYLCRVIKKQDAMNKAERQQLILNRLAIEHHIYIGELCEKLGTSYDSVRRDITELDMAGKLKRVHGGAVSCKGIPAEYTNRCDLESKAKQLLAAKAALLLSDGDTLLVDGGTSNMELIRQLPDNLHLTVYTNSLPLANEFCDRKNLAIHLLGGEVLTASRVTIGVPVVETLQTIRPDWLSLGVCAIEPTIGISAINYEEMLVKRAMVARARKTLAMVDNTKLNTAEPYVAASLADIDYLIVEDEMVEKLRQEWKKVDCKII